MITIAIDGYSACGKSSMAKVLANELGYAYIDSGAMYRAVTLYCINNKIINTDGILNIHLLESQLHNISIKFRYNPQMCVSDTYLNDVCVEDEIRSLKVSNYVSKVAEIAFVRKAMVTQQQLMGQNKGIVMDGRDIGSVVFPKAELKVFVTASEDVRAQRRLKELQKKGEEATLNEVKRNLLMRDKIDVERRDSPLIKCDDAILLDNSAMTLEEQNQVLLKFAIKAIELAENKNNDC